MTQGGAAADVVVVGAGVVGAACAFFAALEGLSVVVVDRGAVAAGTTGRGEGNILVSDKEPGPELDLALLSRRAWQDVTGEVGGFELEPKGGLVVTRDGATLANLRRFSGEQHAHGVEVVDVPADGLLDLEPHLAPDLCGGALYPQDAQVQPMLAAAVMLAEARRRGARVLPETMVTGFRRSHGEITAVTTDRGDVRARAVVNAAGTWGGDVARLAGVALPVMPRRGFVLVTEPLPPMVRHKVYGADYVANVSSSDADLQTSPVVEGTDSGTVLIGSSRERVGFDRTPSLPVLAQLAAGAIALFPALAQVRAMRPYVGFRPYCPDHLPVIGPDPRAPGLWHACGHEGAGVGLAAGTGRLLARALTGQATGLDVHPFRPERFDEAEEAGEAAAHRGGVGRESGVEPAIPARVAT